MQSLVEDDVCRYTFHMSAAKMSRWFNVVYVRGFLKLSHDTITAYIDPSGSTDMWSSSIKGHMSSGLMPNWWDL